MFDGGMVAQSLVEMDRGYMLLRAIGEGSHLAVLTGRDCDMEVVVYEVGKLAEAVGHALTAAPRRNRSVYWTSAAESRSILGPSESIAIRAPAPT